MKLFRTLTFALVIALLGKTSLMSKAPAPGEKQFPHPEVIHYDGHCLTINGKDTFIRSAAFHYFRTPTTATHAEDDQAKMREVSSAVRCTLKLAPDGDACVLITKKG